MDTALSFAGELPDAAFPRELDTVTDFDLAPISTAQRDGDWELVRRLWADSPSSDTLRVVQNERELLRVSTFLWMRPSSESLVEGMLNALETLDSNAVASLLPPTVTAGLYPGNPTIWGFSNTALAASLVRTVPEDGVDATIHRGASGAAFSYVPQPGSAGGFEAIIFLVSQVSSPLYPKADGLFEIAALYFSGVAYPMTELMLSRLDPQLPVLRRAVYGVEQSVYVDPGL